MPKTTMEFSLPEEAIELEIAQKGGVYYSALCDFEQYLRTEIKYNGKDLEEVRLSFYAILEDHKIDLSF